MSEEKINFEASLNRLNEIVNKIQDETLSLDESIALYEEGKKLIALLKDELAEAENKVEKIIEANKK